MNLKTLGDFKKDGIYVNIQTNQMTKIKRPLLIQEDKVVAWQSLIQMSLALCKKQKKTQSTT